MEPEPIPQSEAHGRAHEMSMILRSLYIALGAATLIGDEDLIGQLKPVLQRYRDRTRGELEKTFTEVPSEPTETRSEQVPQAIEAAAAQDDPIANGLIAQAKAAIDADQLAQGRELLQQAREAQQAQEESG